MISLQMKELKKSYYQRCSKQNLKPQIIGWTLIGAKVKTPVFTTIYMTVQLYKLCLSNIN